MAHNLQTEKGNDVIRQTREAALGIMLKAMLAVSITLLSFQAQSMADNSIQPFVLGFSGESDFSKEVSITKEKLFSAGFDIIGEYSPYDDVKIFVITNNELKRTATKSERGGYGAIMRVAITQVGNNVEVAYTNPVYWASAYRLSSDLDGVSVKLKKALGELKTFGNGGKKLTKDDMREYHYTFMMEYFDDPSKLASFKSHDEALQKIEAELAAGAGGAHKIYRIDLGKDSEGVQMTLFGVSLKGLSADDCSGDRYIMSRIDKSSPRHSAHLPYELLVYGSNVEALYARFRIAISWPDLPMLSSDTGATFMSIMCAPGAIEDALKLVTGQKIDTDEEEEY
ncbi:MAG: hypothetical protein ACC707_18045 [Thiohalomonadales bacterium]